MTGNEHTPENPRLHLKESAERLPLYEKLLVVMHNVRVIRIDEASPEELEAIKQIADADTEELVLPKRTATPRSDPKPDKTPPRVKERKKEERKERNVLDALQRHGGRKAR